MALAEFALAIEVISKRFVPPKGIYSWNIFLCRLFRVSWVTMTMTLLSCETRPWRQYCKRLSCPSRFESSIRL